MQPKKRVSSGNSAHEPTNSVGRAQPPNSVRVTQESIQLRRSAYSASAPGAQQLRMTSSTNLHRPCSLRGGSTQAIQLTSPPAQLEELSHPTQDVLLRSNSAYTFSPLCLNAWSLATQNDELNHFAQAMQPRSQFSSGHLAHEPTSSVRRAQPPNSGRVTQESIQLRRSAHLASAPRASSSE